MNEKKTTKETYIIEAMRLFSEKGFDSVGVVEIAKNVGCTTSALYKHFNNKQALFDEILKKSREEFIDNTKNMKINFEQMSDNDLILSIDSQIEMMINLLKKVIYGEKPRLFRMLVYKERNNHPELGVLFNEHYYEGQFKAFEVLMRKWINKNVLIEGDPYIYAVEYTSPLLAMMSYCDNNPEGYKLAEEILTKHIINFNKLYRRTN